MQQLFSRLFHYLLNLFPLGNEKKTKKLSWVMVKPTAPNTHFKR